MGAKSDQSAWLLGIQDARKSGHVVATIPVYLGALASSGDYERFFEMAGKRYCHVIQPRTGYPVSYWQSVTVLASQVVIAGAYTTIAMLMEHNGLDFLQSSGLDFLAIDLKGSIYQHRSDAK
jgi:thiamine biosynthesis lipoprotein